MANMAPVFAMKLFPHLDARIDGGRNWKDGKPVLGPGKTWRGFIAACLLGAITAALQSLIRFVDLAPERDLSSFFYSRSGGIHGPLILGFMLGLGAILGDSVKSFFKRRTGREGGAPWVPFDQLDFVLGGLLFAYLGSLILEALPPHPENWFLTRFAGENWPVLVVIVVLTPGLH